MEDVLGGVDLVNLRPSAHRSAVFNPIAPLACVKQLGRTVMGPQ